MQIDALKTLALRHADQARAGYEPVATGVAGFSIIRTRQPTVLRPQIYQPVFCLVLQGTKELYSGDRKVAFGAMQSLLVTVDLPALTRIVKASPAEPYIALALGLDAALLAEMADLVPEHTEAGGPGFGMGQADGAILDAMGRMAALIGRPEAAGVLEPLIRREIHYWLMTSSHAPMLRRIVSADGNGARIARAIGTIRRDFAARLPVDDLARAAGMSLSAFHAHFRIMTATTPLQFQKSLRLIEARRLLLAGGHSVSQAAFAVGYESPTQFSRDFSRRFGIAPSGVARAESGGAEAA
ncbi:AraC family transcriptional regulator [Fuscibacter oryzae]|uniref:AraC family transcriptional regulator n=1 Tax=Fuscibacter oryzae TaxID=2803939 RepID=A0A8J7SVT3_9RHOB|nr:AraC family transcriptional regulator [Fuscibacter oryzae]MBL4929852.1 AraC family transcriptional regulator [Fuscibacter oryzae]